MSKILLHPQEIETFYVLPTIRRHLAIFMNERGLKQKEIAHILGINSATISQYRSSKRGHQVRFSKEVLDEIKSCAKIINDRTSYLKETQHLLQYIRHTNALCQIHKLFSDVPKECDPKRIGCHHLPMVSS